MTLTHNLKRGLLAALLALPGCVATPTAPLADLAPIAPFDRANADPALWKVSDADTTIYLFGSMHMLKPDVVWFDGPVKAAFDAADEHVIEMIQPDAPISQAVIMERGIRKDGKTLRDTLTPEQRARYEAALVAAGVKPEAFDRLQPWMATVSLASLPLRKLGYTAENGVEGKFGTGAATRKVTRIGLETFEEQIGFFANLPEADQIAFLMATIDSAKDAERTYARMERSWATGDVDDTAKLINEAVSATPTLAKVLLVDRNERWADWIAKRLQAPGTVMVTVGAGHLAGKASVQAALARRGIKTQRLQ